MINPSDIYKIPTILNACAPLVKGNIAIIYAPPRAGKTQAIKSYIKALSNTRQATCIAISFDERPKEAEDLRSSGAITYRAPFGMGNAEAKQQVVNVAVNDCMNRALHGENVVFFVDSLTRIATIYSQLEQFKNSAIGQGGIRPDALTEIDNILSIAGKYGSGSITVVATCLKESSAEEYVAHFFSGRSDSDIFLRKDLADGRIFPSVDIINSMTRGINGIDPLLEKYRDKILNSKRDYKGNFSSEVYMKETKALIKEWKDKYHDA